jgi:anaerobic magnesium-protoporphyrin IX monomethyl ester cyclase
VPILKNLFQTAKNEIGELPFIVAGGPHPSAIPVDTLKEMDFINAVISGPGEIPLSMIVQGKNLEDIPNATYRKNDQIKQTKPADFCPDPKMKMNTFFIHPTGFNLYKQEMKLLSEITSFGCRNNCAYCSTPKYGEHGFIMRDLKVVLEEIEELSDWGEDIAISFKDDNHFTSVKYVKALTKGLKERGLDIQKNAMMDPALITSRRIELCKEGRYSVFVGRDYVTNDAAKKYGRRFMGKPRDVEKEKAKIKSLIDAGIQTEISYIIPGPYDDIQYVRDVVSDMIDLYSKNVGINAAELVPYPNTEIREQLLKDNMIPEKNLHDWMKYTRSLGTVVVQLEPRVEKWWIDYDLIHDNMIQLAYRSNETIRHNQLKIMAMSAALGDIELMERFKVKITAQKQAEAIE